MLTLNLKNKIYIYFNRKMKIRIIINIYFLNLYVSDIS